MTQEQMERTFEFLLDHHAKFAVDHQLFQEDMAKIKEAQAENEQRIKEILAVQSTHQELIEQLTTASLQTFEVIAQLGKAQRQTEERLNILIGVVENHISNHNGNH